LSLWVLSVAFGLLIGMLGFAQLSAAESSGRSRNPAAGTQAASQEKPEAETNPDPQVQAVLEKLASLKVLNPQTTEDVRRAFPVYASLGGPPEKVYRIQERRIPGRAGELAIRLYFSGPGKELPVFIFFHGGGFVAGTLDDYEVPLRAVTNRCDCLVLSVAYRLAPEHHFPAALDDAYAATQWVVAHAAEIGGDPRRVAVGGDGAGGNLAAAVTLMARDRGGPPLVFQVLIYPVLDATMITRSRILSRDPIFSTDTMLAMTGAYVPVDVDLTNPNVSPVYAQNFGHLPPALVITDRDDPVRDEARTYGKKLREAGVPVEFVSYPGAIHGFFLMTGALDAGKQSVERIGNTLRQAFEKAGQP